MVMQIIELILAGATISACIAAFIWMILRLDRGTRMVYLPPMPGWIHSGGRKLRVAVGDAWAAAELQKIALLWEESHRTDASQHGPVLLPNRAVLREIDRADVAAGLIWCVKVRFPELNRLAIWLLGRSGGTLGASAVAELRRHADVRMRREVARALLRMRAWSELQRMTIDSDPQVRRLATPPKQKEFATRLAALAASGITPANPSVSPGPMPLVWDVPPDAGRPPKSASWIREILQRIHRLLRGEATAR